MTTPSTTELTEVSEDDLAHLIKCADQLAHDGVALALPDGERMQRHLVLAALRELQSLRAEKAERRLSTMGAQEREALYGVYTAGDIYRAVENGIHTDTRFVLEKDFKRLSTQPSAAGWKERKLIVDALMLKYFHHTDHAERFKGVHGFEGHTQLAKQCKDLAESIMESTLASDPEGPLPDLPPPPSTDEREEGK